MEELNINPIDHTLSGWLKVEFIDVDFVTATTVTAAGAHVALLSGKLFTVIHTNSIQQSCESQPGNAYLHNITILLPCRAQHHDLTFNSMTHRRYILRLTDNNHQRFIAGCKDDPLRFSFSNSDNGNPADGAAYNLTFSGQSRLPLLPER